MTNEPSFSSDNLTVETRPSETWIKEIPCQVLGLGANWLKPVASSLFS